MITSKIIDTLNIECTEGILKLMKWDDGCITITVQKEKDIAAHRISCLVPQNRTELIGKFFKS